MTTSQKIDQVADQITELIGPITKELGLDNIKKRSQIDIIILIHALNQVAGNWMDEIADGQFTQK